MPKIYFGEAFSLVGKTLPMIWVRLGSYLLLGLALGVYTALFLGIGWLLGRLWAPLGLIVFIVAVGGAFAVVRWAGRYWFHMLRAAHTAVLTEFIVHGRGPAGNQLEYGKQQVLARFTDTNVLFAVDLLVGGAVRTVVRTFTRVVTILPIPGLRSLGDLLERIAVMSTTYIDEAVLSRAYQHRENNVWAVAKEGVVLYAQAWQPILANAVVLALLSFVEFLVFLLILGLPAVAIGAAFPALSTALGIGVLIGAWMLKLAVADAFSLAATLLAYHRNTADMPVNQEWVAKIDAVSDKFRELGRKAVEALRPTERVEPVGARAAASPAATRAVVANLAALGETPATAVAGDMAGEPGLAGGES